jgi:hypothetical protein
MLKARETVGPEATPRAVVQRRSSSGWLWRAIAPALMLALAIAGPAPAQTPVEVGYRDFSTVDEIGRFTGEKPESKLWWNDGYWWGSLYSPSAGGYRIHRFDWANHTWIDTGVDLDDRPLSRADVLWDEAQGVLYVASHYRTSKGVPASLAQRGRLYRYTYDIVNRTYTLDPGFPVVITGGRSETLTLARDSQGRLWATYVESNKVKITWSTTDDATWAPPIDLPVNPVATTVDDDAISSVVAFGGSKIGVMWSNDLTGRTYFAVHLDGQDPTVWQAEEVVLPPGGSPEAWSDDHINLKADSYGRVYAAVKTNLAAPNAPYIVLAVREVSGTWTLHTVSTAKYLHTRPIVLLSEELDTVFVLYSDEGGGKVYYKSAPLSAPVFADGDGDVFIRSSAQKGIDDVTSTKQHLTATTGLLAIASDDKRCFYFHNVIELAQSQALTITSFAPLSGTAGTVVTITGTGLSGVSAVQFNGTPASFTVLSSTSIQAVVPPAATSGPITVTSPQGSASTAQAFAVIVPPAPPSVSGFSPDSGPEGTLVTINGSDFADVLQVTFNGTPTTFVALSASTIEAYVPAGATSGVIAVTTAAGSAASAASFTVTTAPLGEPLHAMTFEDGQLVHPGSGATKIVGPVTLRTDGPVKGQYAAETTANGYLEQKIAATPDLYASFYVTIDGLPSNNLRVIQLSSNGATVGNIVIRTDGRLRLRVDAAGIGADSAPLVPGQVYRIGLRQRAGTGSNGILEAYVAEGDAPFVAPFAATTTGDWTAPTDRVRLGTTASSFPVRVVVDDLQLNGAVMPPPSQ